MKYLSMSLDSDEKKLSSYESGDKDYELKSGSNIESESSDDES